VNDRRKGEAVIHPSMTFPQASIDQLKLPLHFRGEVCCMGDDNQRDPLFPIQVDEEFAQFLGGPPIE
jgi:hypothetical protein